MWWIFIRPEGDLDPLFEGGCRGGANRAVITKSGGLAGGQVPVILAWVPKGASNPHGCLSTYRRMEYRISRFAR
jgi:hypothetical protein